MSLTERYNKFSRKEHLQNGGSVEPTCFLADRLLPLMAAERVWLWQ